jgi:hypothetical protein
MHTRGDMNMNPIDGGTFMTILTTGFYAVTVMLNGIFGLVGQLAGFIQSLAGVAAVLAGFSTLAYNCYRFYNDYKNNKKREGKL